MKTYRFTASVTISVEAEVRATSKREALEAVRDLPIKRLCHECASGDPDREWITSGELDGEPCDIELVEVIV